MSKPPLPPKNVRPSSTLTSGYYLNGEQIMWAMWYNNGLVIYKYDNTCEWLYIPFVLIIGPITLEKFRLRQTIRLDINSVNYAAKFVTDRNGRFYAIDELSVLVSIWKRVGTDNSMKFPSKGLGRGNRHSENPFEQIETKLKTVLFSAYI